MISMIRDTVLASLSSDLIAKLPPADPGLAKLSGDIVARIVDVATPDLLSLMISRGLALGPHLAQLFQSLQVFHATEPDRSEALANVIATVSAPQEKYLSAQGYTLFFMPEGRSIRTPLFAETFRAQLRAFPDLDVSILSHEPSLDDVIKIYLARDMSLETVSDMTFTDPEILAFIKATRSNHGKMQILARTGTLADYLAKEPITTWRSEPQT